MTIDLYTATGTKKGTVTLPRIFEVAINEGLMHQAVVRNQSNRRTAVAHTKRRGDIRGSTRKLFAQKGTGRARRGSVRSPLLRGGSKSFGPNKKMNFSKDMPRKMRRAALRCSLSAQAKNGVIIGLENYPDERQTKKMQELLGKLPVDIGRRILFVLPEKHEGLMLSTRNIPFVNTVLVQYLSPEDVLGARHIVFLADAIKKAEDLFGATASTPEPKPKKKAPTKKATTTTKK